MKTSAPAAVGTPEFNLARWQAKGDGAALGALFDSTAGDLFRIALAVAPDPAAAEDAVQETFLALMEAPGTFDTGRPVMPLLVGILRHKVAKVRRRVVRAPDPRRVDPSIPVEDPAAAAERGEDAVRVRAAILALPETYRKAALLRWTHGLEPAEIAEILEKPPGTVWSLLSRAREVLARALAGAPLAVAAGSRPPRGLAEVRKAVLRRTVSGAAAAAAAAGGVLVAKKVAWGAAALLLLLGSAWVGRGYFQEMDPAPTPTPAAPPPASPGRASPAPTPTPVAAAEGTAIPAAGTEAPASSGGEPASPEQVGVFGSVVDGERGPVEGARVAVFRSDGQVVEMRTDAKGEFLFEAFKVRGSGHLVHHYLVTDGKGRCARSSLYQFVVPGYGEEFHLGGVGMGVMALRPASSLDVLVTAGGAPVAGARVWGEEETALRPRTQDHSSDAAGRARLEWIPEGPWTLHAEAPGAGRGSARVRAPHAGTAVLALVNRTLEIEAFDESGGGPAEGIRFEVWSRVHRDGKEEWDDERPPPPLPPTDSAGRTRLLGRGAEAFLLAAVLPGEEEPREDAPRIEVDPEAVFARVPVRRGRTVRWPIGEGERGPPADGSEVRVGAAEVLTEPFYSLGAELPATGRWGLRKGRVEGREIVVEGLEAGEFHGVVRAPDGSAARLHVPAGADRGREVRFTLPRRLEVVVRDEDGKAVADSIVILKDDGGRPQTLMITPDEEGRTTFEGLPAGEVRVCPLARWSGGGGDALRVDLSSGDREAAIVVGRAFGLLARVRQGGKPGLPAAHDFRVLHPGPGGAIPGDEGDPSEPAEDPAKGEVRFRVRPLAPGRPVLLRLTVPGREPLVREAAPPPAGGEAVVEFDL